MPAEESDVPDIDRAQPESANRWVGEESDRSLFGLAHDLGVCLLAVQENRSTHRKYTQFVRRLSAFWDRVRCGILTGDLPVLNTARCFRRSPKFAGPFQCEHGLIVTKIAKSRGRDFIPLVINQVS